MKLFAQNNFTRRTVPQHALLRRFLETFKLSEASAFVLAGLAGYLSLTSG
ncbi:MAG TPA: hypothetical protein VGB09_00980 [Candidatus Binatia bacterium]